MHGVFDAFEALAICWLLGSCFAWVFGQGGGHLPEERRRSCARLRVSAPRTCPALAGARPVVGFDRCRLNCSGWGFLWVVAWADLCRLGFLGRSVRRSLLAACLGRLGGCAWLLLLVACCALVCLAAVSLMAWGVAGQLVVGACCASVLAGSSSCGRLWARFWPVPGEARRRESTDVG